MDRTEVLVLCIKAMASDAGLEGRTDCLCMGVAVPRQGIIGGVALVACPPVPGAAHRSPRETQSLMERAGGDDVAIAADRTRNE
jgi:hypothetical protein